MLVLIDGHNLIAKIPDISLNEADDEEKLILKIRQYRAKTGRRVHLIFDSGGEYKPASKQTRGGITIQYAPHGKTADELIVSCLQKSKHPQQILVVTSDRRVQSKAKQVRAKVISSTDFAAELPPSFETTTGVANIKLSEDEIEEWLNLFNQSPKE
jgi:hypothetical protein